MLSRVPPTPSGQALAESLKSNGNLLRLYLEKNNIGDRGAQAPAAECSDSLGIAGADVARRVIVQGMGDVAIGQIGQFLQRPLRN